MVASGAPVLRDVLTASLDAVLGRPNALGLPSRRRVIVLVVDGLGDEALTARAGHARTLAGSGRRRIRTGSPTTTAAALTTLATGSDPGTHGVVSFSALEPVGDRVVNQLRGFDSELPEGWQRSRTVFERAADEGLGAFAVGPRHYATSGFTRAVLRGAQYVGARSIEDRGAAALGALRTAGRGIAYCYVPELDVAAHRDGWGSSGWTDLLERVDGTVRDVAQDLRAGETLLVTADHGMVDVPETSHVVLADLGLLDSLRLLAGEPRLLHVHLARGTDADAAASRWAEALGSTADVLTRAAAVGAGWFGAAEPEVLPRIGDLLVAARGRAAFYATADAPSRGMVGQHGSWTTAERFVPLVRFDG
jgi:predicted AlkP superfamily pyrophosphatase or phosphodiesterase